MNRPLYSILFLVAAGFSVAAPAVVAESRLEFLDGIKKFDAHVHDRADEAFHRKLLEEGNWKDITICVDTGDRTQTNFQRRISRQLYEKYPRYYAWITAFSVEGIWEPGWQEREIAALKEDFANGAIGVKVWKSVGMGLKTPEGEYVQLDHPIFTPIFEFIAEQDKTLLTHTGEPIHAWMMTFTTEDGIHRNSWAKRPQYSFYDKPDRPSYSDIMAARDHVLARHPDLRFVGAHMASLEFDVAEVAMRMDMYPNFAVELGGRANYLMWQSRAKVRAFFEKYQDRILYGTDLGVSHALTDEKRADIEARFHERHGIYAQYLATNDEIPFGDILVRDKPAKGGLEYNVTGLALSEEILQKVYYDNIVRWFPGAEKDFTN